MEPSLLEKAARVAAVAHKDQKRKEADVPYIEHPIVVAIILAQHGFGEEVIAAGLVHDVLEDTEYPEVQMRAELGEGVMAIVDAVTNDDSLSWDEKKKKYIETVRAGSKGARAVATADKIANARSLVAAHAREGSAVWAHFNAGREKKLWFENAMLAMLEETWQHPLVEEYAALVAQMNALD
ncbi:MAG TPA: HD domain-containing protein [Candidatus Paceibacterota bacterium]|nr:HD domain-containing protein [Candidatus Paceibacterota bacterium]